MAGGKPLTRFLLALCHSADFLAAFNSQDRRARLLEDWGLADHELFTGPLTIERVQAAVAAEHEGESSVEVAWWIWFLGGPPGQPKPDWVWGVDDTPEDDTYSGGGQSNQS